MIRAFWMICASSLLVACSSSAPMLENDEPIITEDAMAQNHSVGVGLAPKNVWHEAGQRGVTFRAVGQEPGWLLEISRDEGVLLKTHYGQAEKRYPYAAPVVDSAAGVRRFRLDQLTVVIRENNCTDVMSGEQFLFSVKLLYDDRYLTGCGRNLDSIDGASGTLGVPGKPKALIK